MARLSDEMIAKARELDLLTYLQQQEPWELVLLGHNRYCTRTHDSLKIDHGKWYWWSQNVGGQSALDYLILVEGWEFRRAVFHILAIEKIPAAEMPRQQKEKKREERSFLLPKRAGGNEKVRAYLMGRGIDPEILDDFIEKGLLYESAQYHNAVFVGVNERGEPAYAALRSTEIKRFAGEAAGSKKEYAFSFSEGTSETIHVFECAIDLLSYATLMKMKGFDWKKDLYVSLGGCAFSVDAGAPPALSRMLKTHKAAKVIRLHLDNDATGRKCMKKIKRLLAESYTVVDSPPPRGKDVNDYLLQVRQEERSKTEHEERRNTLYDKKRTASIYPR